ncbi:MAG: MFS transporter [Williamsia sp.]|nr:MFS transporter [Williamsia sp.]
MQTDPAFSIPIKISPRQLRLATTVYFFISGFGYSSWASRIPSIQQRLHLNEAQLGGVLLSLPIGLMLTLPVTGTLLSRYNTKKIMLFGVVFYNLVLSLPGFTTTLMQLVAVLFCFGSSRNILNLSINAQAVGVQELYKTSIMTTFHGVWSVAGFTGAAVGYVMVLYNIAPAWHLMGVAFVLMVLALWLYPYALSQEPVRKEHRPFFSFPDKSLLNFAFICFACMACENTMYDWSVIYFQKVVHTPKAAANAAYVVYMVAMTIGRFAGDRVVTKIGVKNILHLSGWLIFTGLMLAVLLPYPVIAGMGFTLVGLGVSCVVPLVFKMAAQSAATSSGHALASISSIGYLGFLLVPPMVGFVAQKADLRWSFGIIATLGLLLVAMVYSIREERVHILKTER